MECTLVSGGDSTLTTSRATTTDHLAADGRNLSPSSFHRLRWLGVCAVRLLGSPMSSLASQRNDHVSAIAQKAFLENVPKLFVMRETVAAKVLSSSATAPKQFDALKRFESFVEEDEKQIFASSSKSSTVAMDSLFNNFLSTLVSKSTPPSVLLPTTSSQTSQHIVAESDVQLAQLVKYLMSGSSCIVLSLQNSFRDAHFTGYMSLQFEVDFELSGEIFVREIELHLESLYPLYGEASVLTSYFSEYFGGHRHSFQSSTLSEKVARSKLSLLTKFHAALSEPVELLLAEVVTGTSSEDLSNLIDLCNDRYLRSPRLQASAYRRLIDVSSSLSVPALLEDLADVLLNNGDNAEAVACRRKAVDASRKVLEGGRRNPLTIKSTAKLAALLAEQGNCSEAAEMCRECLLDSEKAVGKKHVGYLSVLTTLAAILELSHDMEEAQQLYEQSVAGFKSTVGWKSSLTINAMISCGLCHEKSGRRNEAISLYKEAVETQSEKLGKLHEKTLGNVQILVAALLAHGNAGGEVNWLETEVLANRVREGYLALRGNADPSTLAAATTLIAIREKLGMDSAREVEALLTEAERITKQKEEENQVCSCVIS